MTKSNRFLAYPISFLNDRNSKIFLAIFSALLGIISLRIYQPASVDDFIVNSWFSHKFSIIGAGILAALTISFSQFILRPLLKVNSFTVFTFSIWVLFEFFWLTLAYYIFFGDWASSLSTEFLIVFKDTMSLGIIPYTISCLLLITKSAYWPLSANQDSFTIKSDTVTIRGVNDKIMLILNVDDILYLKSEDNYAQIHYLNNGKEHKKLIRTSLKKLDAEIENPDLVRIHRSYIVNFRQLHSVERNKGKLSIIIKHAPTISFPVSATYRKNVELKIQNSSPHQTL